MDDTTPPVWPDPLTPPDPRQVHTQLIGFWHQLADLGPVLAERQWLVAAEQIDSLRRMVLDMMLALNGIARPPATRSLNSYLSASQRAALEKTLHLSSVDAEGFIGQAVALVVIYRWYAPQLLDRFGGSYPDNAEQVAWHTLTTHLPDWPIQVTTD